MVEKLNKQVMIAGNLETAEPQPERIKRSEFADDFYDTACYDNFNKQLDLYLSDKLADDHEDTVNIRQKIVIVSVIYL